MVRKLICQIKKYDQHANAPENQQAATHRHRQGGTPGCRYKSAASIQWFCIIAMHFYKIDVKLRIIPFRANFRLVNPQSWKSDGYWQ